MLVWYVQRMTSLSRWLFCASVLALGACSSVLRVKGSPPVNPRPVFAEVTPPERGYKVWVMIPWLKVNMYPLRERAQQPLLQFTGDQRRLSDGTGKMTMLVARDRYQNGDEVRYFAHRVLWSGRLAEDDRRTFTFWLRENNRSAPTQLDQDLANLSHVAQVVEELTSATGFKIPAHQAIAITGQMVKALQKDWLIMRWSCPWGHVLAEARKKLAGPRRRVLLSTRLVSAERTGALPVAEVEVLFVVERLDRPLPLGISR